VGPLRRGLGVSDPKEARSRPSSLEKAHELNPNDATILVEYGWALALSGRPEEGIPLMHHAIRLNPFTPEWYWHNLAKGYFVAGQYEEALSAIEKITQPYSITYRRLAIYAQVGRLEDARVALAQYLKLEPQMTLDRVVEAMPFSRQDDYERFREALRKAGLPEKALKPDS
jgi:adenylate cyclase